MRNWRFNTIKKLSIKIGILKGQKKKTPVAQKLKMQIIDSEIKNLEERKQELKNEIVYMESLGVND